QLDLPAQLGQDFTYEVVLAHAHSSGGDHQIRTPCPRLGEVLAQALLRVARQAQVHGDAAGPADQRVQRVGIGARDLITCEDVVRTVQVHDLVARPHARYAWRIVDQRGRVGDAREATRLNSSHGSISYAVFCLKKKSRNQK